MYLLKHIPKGFIIQVFICTNIDVPAQNQIVSKNLKHYLHHMIFSWSMHLLFAIISVRSWGTWLYGQLPSKLMRHSVL